MPLAQCRFPPPLSHNSRPCPVKFTMSSQRSFASSPHDSSGSVETLADDLHAQECVAPSARSSTRLAHLNNLDNVPVPWAETTDRLADNRGPVKRKYGRRGHKSSILGEGLSNDVERSRPTYLGDANESHLSPARSPAVTNLTLDLPPSPLAAHRDLDSDVDASFTSKRRHSRFYLSDTLVTLEVSIFTIFIPMSLVDVIRVRRRSMAASSRYTATS